ncbi:MAG: S-layer glycoprotein N-glycosyltransferase AglJ [Methanomicrobiales archaeon]|nr:S-layer glycoprotein N-glycosyltransferase AglJ [Methanomicrobiales archaeon]
MDLNREEVCILVPTLNEAPTVGAVIQEFRRAGYSHILVMDGRSTDGTLLIAQKEGADVHTQSSRGKGNAIIEAIPQISQPYVLMVDGDGTYSARDADRMVEPLFHGYQQVIGERTGEGSFSRMNRLGNWLINILFKMAHGRYLSDILSGYRAFTLESMHQMRLKEEGFEIETEMVVQAMKNNQQIAVVPVEYGIRKGTRTKLKPFQDGFRIIRAIYRLARVNNPLFYFGLIGVILFAGGAVTGVYVLLEWFKDIEHLPLTILTLLLITLGFEMVMFGVIGDMMLAFHREIQLEIQEIRLQQQKK